MRITKLRVLLKKVFVTKFKNITSIHEFCMDISTVPPTIYLQINFLALCPSLICRHAQIPASVGHLSRVDV